MRPRGDDAALIHDGNAIRIHDRRKTVRDDNRRAALHQTLKGSLDQTFILRIQSTGRFVQQQDRRVPQDCTGD